MKDIHGQSPSPPIARPKTAAAEFGSSEQVEASDHEPVASPQPEPAAASMAEVVETERIQLDLTPTGQTQGIQFDQSIQLSP